MVSNPERFRYWKADLEDCCVRAWVRARGEMRDFRGDEKQPPAPSTSLLLFFEEKAGKS